jgi:acyl-coenzyme A synthetase/AMP-(fatty) acid ligase
LLAFEQTGVATFSYTKQEAPVYLPFLRSADLVVCAEDAVPKDSKKVLLLSQKLLDGIFALAPQQEDGGRFLASDMPLRIQCTSGATGRVKRMVRTAQVNEFRIWQYQNKEGYNCYSHYLLTHPFSVQAIYGRANACIRMGGACVSVASDVFQAITDYGVTHLAVLPTMLAKAAAALPAGFLKPNILMISTFGAPVSRELRERILQTLATELIESYGTNEVGSVCTIGSDGTGLVVAGVRVEVVDKNNKPLIGQTG